MRVELTGTAGPGGWPVPGCRCASCRRAGQAGSRRAFGAVVDGELRLGGTSPLRCAGYAITDVAGGWDVTGPGGRLLIAAPGAAPVPPPDAGPYDVALLDLLAGPAQLGGLRRRGLVTGHTAVAVVHVDHRVSSPGELARRCELWGVRLPADGDVLTAPGPAGDREPAWQGSRTLVLGGARSGKSSEAELRLAAEPEVRYVATGPRPRDDADWAARVAAHRARRPAWWQTVETADVAAELGRANGALLVDGIGGWLAAAMDACGSWSAGPDRALQRRIDALVAAWRDCPVLVVAVSEETGLGVIPATGAGRLFRDQLGALNQRLAAEADQTVLVVAGKVVSLPG